MCIRDRAQVKEREPGEPGLLGIGWAKKKNRYAAISG